MFGPHFYYDLIRLARKRRNLFIRCGYLLALLLGWSFFYEENVPIAGLINEYARLAVKYTNLVLTFQYAMIILVTPAYLSGAFLEEKANGTLELLFQTQLANCEILLGKFAARVVHLVFFMLLNLPLLAIISLWGGVSMESLAFHFGLSFFLILFLGSICLWASVAGSDMRESLVISYSVCFISGMLGLGGSFLVFSIVSTVISLPPLLELILLAPLVFLGGGFFFLLALHDFVILRERSLYARSPMITPNAWPRPRKEKSSRSQSYPTISGNPFFWKEAVRNSCFPSIWPFALLPIAVDMFVCCLCYFLGKNDFPTVQQELALLARLFLVLVHMLILAIYVVRVASQTTSSVAGEGQQNTLDFLLTLPRDREEILFFKWIGPWISNWPIAVAALAGPFLGWMFGFFSLRTVLLSIVLAWPFLFMVSSLSLLLSVACRRVMTAHVVLTTILLLLFLLHLLRFDDFALLLQGYFLLLLEYGQVGFDAEHSRRLTALIVMQQSVFLIGALGCLGVAFWLFKRMTSEARAQVS
jgi:ABC-type transport system involved in multi-copper enzyme maturation permease subunit